MNYQFDLETLKKNLEHRQDDPAAQLKLLERFCQKYNLEPEGPFPKSQQELIELQQRGVAPQLESVLEVYLGVNGKLEENALGKNIDRTLDQQMREQAGMAPHAEGHLQQAEKQNPDPSDDATNWAPKPKGADWPPKP